MRIALLCLLLAGCANQYTKPPPPPEPVRPRPLLVAKASDAEKQQLEHEYMTYLKVTAYQMDDGTSDAQTIAAAVRPRCIAEWQRVYESQVRGADSSVVRAIFEGREDWQRQDSLDAVLMMRKLRPK